MNQLNVKDDKREPTYRKFHYFELVTIFLFIPLVLVQFILAYDLLSYIGIQTTLFHYYFVTQRLMQMSYNADYTTILAVPLKKRTYKNTYTNNCPGDQGYGHVAFTRISSFENVSPIEITNSINLVDPDFPQFKLDPSTRGMKFWKFDIGQVNPDPAKYQSIQLSTGYNFVEWKGKRICQKRIFFDTQYTMMKIISGNLDCQKVFGEFARDCGSYLNNLYRICVLRNLARDRSKKEFADDPKLLYGTDNICPVTNLEIASNSTDFKLVTTIRNNPSLKGEVDQYFMVVFDPVTFQNPKTNPEFDYDVSTYNGAETCRISNNATYGLVDLRNVELDYDNFITFANYTLNYYIYYPGFMNGTSQSDFFMPYDSTNSVKAVLWLLVTRSVSEECFKKVYIPRKQNEVFGFAKELNVDEYFNYLLTFLIWVFASFFFVVYSLANIRVRVILMKLNGTINNNNKNAEEISKWTNFMIWFIIFGVKILINSIMMSLTTQQLNIVKDLKTYNCFAAGILLIFDKFDDFILMCSLKSEIIMIFLIIELFFQTMILIGYIFIWIRNKKKQILLERILKQLKVEEEIKEKKTNSEKEKLL